VTEGTDAPDDSRLEQALAGGHPQRVGSFRFFFDSQRWEWSPEVAMMHGYAPGTVEPTTRLVLSHKHPEDHHHIAATLEQIRHTRGPFSTRHRIIDTAGIERQVITVGEKMRDDTGAVVGTQGFYIDVTRSPQQMTDEQFATAVADFTQNRTVIEQVKGMLMVIYGIDEEAAFEILRWRSQETNVKLRVLAGRVRAGFRRVSAGGGLATRTAYDSVLMTAHTDT
jgi:hypothetical protein